MVTIKVKVFKLFGGFMGYNLGAVYMGVEGDNYISNCLVAC